MQRKPIVVAAVLMLASSATTAVAQQPAPPDPSQTGSQTAAPAPSPRPKLKAVKATSFPFRPWSYAKAYTYNFFAMQPVPTRVYSNEHGWSPHIRSEQVISDAHAKRAAELAAVTRGSIELTKCTFPRHAIIYFDNEDKPVASLDVCFDCEAVLAWPDYDKPESFNYERMGQKFEKTLPLWRRLFEHDLKLPIDYRTAGPER